MGRSGWAGGRLRDGAGGKRRLEKGPHALLLPRRLDLDDHLLSPPVLNVMLAARSFTLSMSRRAFSTSARRLDLFEKVSAETFAKEVANAEKGKLTLVDFYAE